MTCPNCGGPTTVLETREYTNGHVRRSRECLDCDFRFTTREQVARDKRPKTIDFRMKHWLDIALAPMNKEQGEQ